MRRANGSRVVSGERPASARAARPSAGARAGFRSRPVLDLQILPVVLRPASGRRPRSARPNGRGGRCHRSRRAPRVLRSAGGLCVHDTRRAGPRLQPCPPRAVTLRRCGNRNRAGSDRRHAARVDRSPRHPAQLLAISRPRRSQQGVRRAAGELPGVCGDAQGRDARPGGSREDADPAASTDPRPRLRLRRGALGAAGARVRARGALLVREPQHRAARSVESCGAGARPRPVQGPSPAR